MILVVVALLLIAGAIALFAFGFLGQSKTQPVQPPDIINDNQKNINVIVPPTTEPTPTEEILPTATLVPTKAPTVAPTEKPLPTETPVVSPTEALPVSPTTAPTATP
jgi:hypothetical protein